MFNINRIDTEYMKWIRLSRTLCNCNSKDFVVHIYNSVLMRDPEHSVLLSDPVGSAEFYSDRIEYIFSVLFSAESTSKHTNYINILSSLVAALGYKGSRDILAGLISEYYPTLETLMESSSDFIGVLSRNTELFMQSTINSERSENENIESIEGLGPDILARIRHLTDVIGRLSDEMKHISWSVADLKVNISAATPSVNINGELKSYLDVIVTMLERKYDVAD